MKELMAKLVSISGDFDGWMYSTVLFWALIIVGLFFSVRTKFVQIRLLPEGIRVLTEKSHEGGMSSFQALMIATASRVGTGNIAGVATAVVAGGTGSCCLNVDYGYRWWRICIYRVNFSTDL